MTARKRVSKSEREARAEPTTAQQQASIQQFPAESSRARVWELHLRGMSKVRIAAAVGLNRETVAKIIQRCYAEIAPERKVSPARKLDAAVARWRLVQEQAWADHDADDERERQVLGLPFSTPAEDGPPRKGSESNVTVRYQSQRSQYLRIILDAEKEIARLEGLYENILDVDGAVGFVVIRRDSQGIRHSYRAKRSDCLVSALQGHPCACRYLAGWRDMTTAQQQRARRAPVRKPAARSSATGKLQFELNPRQYDFVFSPARFSFYVGGRGAGKSYAGALRSIIQSQEQPGSLGLVGAPTYPMLRDAAQRMFFELCPPALLARHNKTENVTVFRNGSEILWRPAFEYDRYRGLNLAWFWLDEAPWCGYEAWQILKATLRQSGYQTAAWATGTPRGRDGYARDFELAPQDGHALYRASTWANAHNLPASFVADLGYSGAFAEQEIEGLFVAFDGLVYMLDATENGNLRAGDGDYGRVIGGIDWGYTNPTALLVFGLDGDKRAWQLDEFYQRRASMEEIIRTALVKLTKQYNVSVWYADAADPEAIDGANNALARAGLQCRVRAVQKGAGSVRAGIQTVTSLLALRGDGTRGLYIDPKCVNTIAEFGSYAYATTERAKRDPAEEPIKQSDHAMDATRYALWSAFGQQTAVDAYLHEMSRLVRPKPAQPEGYFR